MTFKIDFKWLDSKFMTTEPWVTAEQVSQRLDIVKNTVDHWRDRQEWPDHRGQQCLCPALAKHLIEMTLPNKPSSRLQQYRLTEKGRSLLQSNGAKNE